MDSNGITDQIVYFLLELAPHVSMASHIPGRVRLKVSRKGIDVARSKSPSRLKENLHSIRGVKSFRFKLLSRSLVVDYDPEVLEGDLWEDLAKLEGDPVSAVKVSERVRALIEP
jgi:hypothetical protein